MLQDNNLSSDLLKLIDDFSFFDDWEERYRYLIDIGRKLSKMDESLKTDETLVRGCTSRVWVHVDIQDNVLHFVADSDAHIVRGLIALLVRIYEGKMLEEIAEIDIHAVFEEIGLNQNLSPNRRNGFFAMVERIRSFADF
ncbi:MAG: SufE family protein [Alphaproteobacteria bacterium]|nr:SufE family protein [Alphaproteobacteria bacterium]